MTMGDQLGAGERQCDLHEVIRGRRSVRRFLADPVADLLVEQVLEAGRWAPSPHGTQPWRFAVLTHAATKTELADAMATAWQHNLAMDGQDPDLIAKRLASSRRRLLETPVLILICLYLEDLDRYPDAERQAAEHTMAIQSLGACAQNMLLAAYGRGLDMGWMCAPLFCPDVARDALELPHDHVPHALLQLGYAAADPKRPERRRLDELITLWK
jgi:F420 biosynthesis protein FbiB-like protein